MAAPKTEGSSFGFLNAILVLIASFGLALLLLWVASRVAGVSAFEYLPDWLRSGTSRLFTALASGGSFVALIYNAIKEKSQTNYLFAIIGVTILLLLLIVLLVHIFKPPVEPRTKAEFSPPTIPAYTPTTHTEDKEGHPYVVYWQTVPNCVGFHPDSDHRCDFTHTQMSFSGDNTPFDHWDISVKTPGAVYDVDCETTGTNEFNEVKGNTKGLIEGNWARCKGWINGGNAPINVTARYKMVW